MTQKKKTAYYFLFATFLVLYFTSIILLNCSCLLPELFQSRRAAWENRCKLTLRALGSTELAYADGNLDKNYGTWEELMKADYIQKGYWPENIIDNYTIVVFDITKSQKNEDGKIVKKSTFTIVAIPKSQKNKLRTFAIGDDQTPLVWVGDEKKWTTENVALHDKELWEPLR